jgi:hypothetical protein
MRSLIRHELRWALPAAGLGALFHLWILADAGADNLWFFPTQKWLSLTYYLFGSLLLGLATSWGDDLLHTREYRAHRPISARALFWARHLTALAVLAVGMVVPLLLNLLGSIILSKDAALIEPGRLGVHLTLGCSVFTCYALVVFCASLCRTGLGAILLAFGQLCSASAVIWLGLLLFPRGMVIALVLSAVTVAPLLLIAAQWADQQGRDRDVPWRPRTALLAAPLLVLLSTVAAAVVVGGWESGAGGLLLELYPRVVSDGNRLLLERYTRLDHRFWEVDQQHRTVAALPDPLPTAYDPFDGPWRAADRPGQEIGTFPQRGFRFGGHFHRWVSALATESTSGFLSDDGYLHLFRRARFDGQGDDRPWTRTVGKGDGPFAPEDRVLRDGPVLAIRDGKDGALWLLDPEANPPRFVRHALPGGDHLVAAVASWYRPRLKVAVPRAVTYVGERGAYVLQDGELRSQDFDPAELASARAQGVATIDGPTSFTAVVDGPGGPFVHHYRPQLPLEHLVAGLLRLGSVARPPLLAAPSAFTSARSLFEHQIFYLDWGIAAGDWLALGGNLVLALALAALAFRRLSRTAMPAGRRWAWTIAVLLTGVPGYLCQRLIETDRAWRQMPSAAKQEQARLLVFKAA